MTAADVVDQVLVGVDVLGPPDELAAQAAAEEEEDEGPDFLLRESAHIVADMAELGADINLLKQQGMHLQRWRKR